MVVTDGGHSQLRSDLRRSALWGLLAAAVLTAGSWVGGLSATGMQLKLTVVGLAVVFVVLGLLATRSAARGVGHAATHTSPAAGAGARLLCQLVGYVCVLVGVLGLLAVPLERLLIGGALTGVVVGIAAQQPLSNLIAGLVLLLARPVTVGTRIRVHSGALGGPFEGCIIEVGLIYTTLSTVEEATREVTTLRLPNAALLASALHTLPPPPTDTGPAQAPDGSGDVSGAGEGDSRDAQTGRISDRTGAQAASSDRPSVSTVFDR